MTTPLNVTVSSATQSAGVYLPPKGDFILSFRSAGAFVLDVQESPIDSDYKDTYDVSGQVIIDSSSGTQSVRVSGGNWYRMDVGTYNSVITMYAAPVGE